MFYSNFELVCVCVTGPAMSRMFSLVFVIAQCLVLQVDGARCNYEATPLADICRNLVGTVMGDKDDIFLVVNGTDNYFHAYRGLLQKNQIVLADNCTKKRLADTFKKMYVGMEAETEVGRVSHVISWHQINEDHDGKMSRVVLKKEVEKLRIWIEDQNYNDYIGKRHISERYFRNFKPIMSNAKDATSNQHLFVLYLSNLRMMNISKVFDQEAHNESRVDNTTMRKLYWYGRNNENMCVTDPSSPADYKIIPEHVRGYVKHGMATLFWADYTQRNGNSIDVVQFKLSEETFDDNSCSKEISLSQYSLDQFIISKFAYLCALLFVSRNCCSWKAEAKAEAEDEDQCVDIAAPRPSSLGWSSGARVPSACAGLCDGLALFLACLLSHRGCGGQGQRTISC